MSVIGCRSFGIVIILSSCCWLATTAYGAQTARFHAGFSPDRLNADTTIELGFEIVRHGGGVPSPLTTVAFSLPAGIRLGNSTLGENICTLPILEKYGSAGCPANALMGRGQGLVELPIGSQIVKETTEVNIFMGPPIDEHTGMLFYATTTSPVFAEVEFTSAILPSQGPYSVSLNTFIPPVPTLPGAPNAAVVHMHIAIGPRNVRYYTYRHGKKISYRPVGMAVPPRCPRGGFPFAAAFLFEDGTTARAQSKVSCPRRHR